MGEEDELPIITHSTQENAPKKRLHSFILGPFYWFKMLAMELHWSFVFGVVVIYGISQGFGGGFAKVSTEYYLKDEQKVQPSEAQIYSGIISIPWIVKPLWGLLTDVVPVLGYHRRPYFILAGAIGVLSMLSLALHPQLHIVYALLLLTAGSAGVAIADVTVDACVAQNSGSHPSLAADMQSLCALSSSIGGLVGFSLSGIFVHLIGPKGVLGLLSIPAVLVLSVGILIKESRPSNSNYLKVNENFALAAKSMWKTLKSPSVWRPCLYMYLSFALSLNIFEGMFYWVTDAKDGPAFSKESMGFIFAIGSVGSLLGAILFQYGLKDYQFRDLLFWAQLLFVLSGMLDLVLVLRINLRFGLPDYLCVVIDAIVSNMIGRLKWMPLLVLSSKLCPHGIEGTFFALLMAIDNAGLLTSSWGGGVLLHVLKVTRTQFDNLWLAILIRNIIRITPLCLLFLVPRGDSSSSLILPDDDEAALGSKEEGHTRTIPTSENVELVALVSNNSSSDDARHS
ncbi:hypothetical protein Leryth_003539 [Lithospermum erythrorhizon]|nr:hypothetical protein Leryth_003539 [Lithospermum erythrorhizon]